MTRHAAFLVVTLTMTGAARAGEYRQPAVEEVVAAAREQAGRIRGRAVSWRRRLGWSAVLPKLTTRVTRSLGWKEGWDLGPRQSGQDLDHYLSLRWEVRATWDLSRLVFDQRVVGVSRRASKLGQERRKLAGRVIQLYYERCGLIHLLRDTGTTLEQSVRRKGLTRLLEVTALLNSLTGGVLSRERAR